MSSRTKGSNGGGAPAQASNSTAKIVVWVLVAAAAGALMFFLLKPSGGGIVNVDGAGVDKARAQGAQVLDVRSPGEFELGHIPGAVNMPVDTLQQSAANLDRDATYVVYCATGSRSAAAIQTMQAMGFKNIKHLADGIQVYQGELEKGGEQSSQTIPTNGKPVFVEFYTDSWPSCQKMKPLVEGLEKQYQDKVEFRRLNVETDSAANDLAQKLGVQYVPTFIYVNADGAIAKQVVGEQTESQLREGLDGLQ